MNKQAVIYGAGNIGRGFAAQLLHESGYDIIFIDVDENTVNNINKYEEYPIYIANPDGYKRIVINRISAVNGNDIKSTVQAVSIADVMITCVGVNALPYIVSPIAEGIKLRSSPLTIILCENKIDADTFLNDLVAKETDTANVSFVRTSVGCMVPAVSEEIRKMHPLAIAVERYKTLYADKNGFKHGIPDIKHLQIAENFQLCMQQKLYMHNMSHAATAYFGKKYKYVYEAIRDSDVKFRVMSALMESANALASEYKIDVYKDLMPFVFELLRRYDNKLLGDTTERVGRDTKRKLSYNDRLSGALRLCVKHGIKAIYIKQAMIAGMEFEPESELGKFYIENGFHETLKRYCGITDEDLTKKIDRL